MSLRKFKMGNLGKKLELQAFHQKEATKIGDEIDKALGDKKVKIKRKLGGVSPKGVSRKGK